MCQKKLVAANVSCSVEVLKNNSFLQRDAKQRLVKITKRMLPKTGSLLSFYLNLFKIRIFIEIFLRNNPKLSLWWCGTKTIIKIFLFTQTGNV